jgi:hypothetical protein
VNLLLITFALRNPKRDYSQFFVTLRGNALQWWHYIEQTCLVTTFNDVEKYTMLLVPYIEPTDSLLVVKITPQQYQGWLPRDAWDWINKVSGEVDQLPLPLATVIPPPPKLNR